MHIQLDFVVAVFSDIEILWSVICIQILLYTGALHNILLLMLLITLLLI